MVRQVGSESNEWWETLEHNLFSGETVGDNLLSGGTDGNMMYSVVDR